mgnify:CR=1 FL=1
MDSVEKIEFAAQIAHEANRAYSLQNGDASQPAWTDAPEHVKASAINGVTAIVNAPNSSPADSHANWMAHKAQEGWTYGPSRDEEKKTHPYMVPYHELPEAARVKDIVFGAAARGALAAYAGK